MTALLLRRFRSNGSGATAVEFALVAAPLLILIFGSIEFGRLAWAQQALSETAVTAARCMGIPEARCSVSGVFNTAAAIAVIKSEAKVKGLALTDADVDIDRDATCNGYGGFSSVDLTYSFETAVPQVVASLAGGKTVTARACFPNQGS